MSRKILRVERNGCGIHIRNSPVCQQQDTIHFKVSSNVRYLEYRNGEPIVIGEFENQGFQTYGDFLVYISEAKYVFIKKIKCKM